MLPSLEGGQKNSPAVFEDSVRADSEQLKESGSTCMQGTRVHCSAKLNSPRHLLECYKVFRYFLQRQLS